ncbi:MAG: hypothetical protein HMLIMOIP_002641 [Candidatus Nitrosomirales archaeon]|jgi:hypothetical protein
MLKMREKKVFAMKKLMLASITLGAILAISAIVPMATAAKPQHEFDQHIVIVQMNGEIDNADLMLFVDPLPEDHKRLMKAAWVEFAQLVQATPPDQIVPNEVICAEIPLHVEYNGLYTALRSAALCT